MKIIIDDSMSIDEIKMLDVTERIILVEEIWDSIAKDQENLGLSEYEKGILNTRLTSLDNNTDNLMSWNEIKNKIRS
jgi:putative addiction module component (TIGR02574 family)